MSNLVQKKDYVVAYKKFNPFDASIPLNPYFVKEVNSSFYVLEGNGAILTVPKDIFNDFFVKTYIWSKWKEYKLSNGEIVQYKTNRKKILMRGTSEYNHKGIKVKATCDAEDDFDIKKGLNLCEARFMNKINSNNISSMMNTYPITSGSCLLTHVKGDILNCPNGYCLVHCVNADMFNNDEKPVGLAKTFDDMYNLRLRVSKYYDKPSSVGEVYWVDNLFTLVVAENRYDNVDVNNLKICLNDLAKMVSDNCLINIAMPKICSGRKNGLPWSVVEDMILEAFKNVRVNIFIYSL